MKDCVRAVGKQETMQSSSVLLVFYIFSIFSIFKTSGIICEHNMRLKSYPHQVYRGSGTCEGVACVYINVNKGQDIAKKQWEGWGRGCDPGYDPLCTSLGIKNQCKSLKWTTFNMFDIESIIVLGEGMICCCDRKNKCIPEDPTGSSDPIS